MTGYPVRGMILSVRAVARCQVATEDRLILVLGYILTSAALRVGMPPLDSHNPRYERSQTQ